LILKQLANNSPPEPVGFFDLVATRKITVHAHMGGGMIHAQTQVYRRKMNQQRARSGR
jgi:hypothetical protein